MVALPGFYGRPIREPIDPVDVINRQKRYLPQIYAERAAEEARTEDLATEQERFDITTAFTEKTAGQAYELGQEELGLIRSGQAADKAYRAGERELGEKKLASDIAFQEETQKDIKTGNLIRAGGTVLQAGLLADKVIEGGLSGVFKGIFGGSIPAAVPSSAPGFTGPIEVASLETSAPLFAAGAEAIAPAAATIGQSTAAVTGDIVGAGTTGFGAIALPAAVLAVILSKIGSIKSKRSAGQRDVANWLQSIKNLPDDQQAQAYRDRYGEDWMATNQRILEKQAADEAFRRTRPPGLRPDEPGYNPPGTTPPPSRIPLRPDELPQEPVGPR